MTANKSNYEFQSQHKTPKFDYQIALVGTPNCGKTTLFNRLTGAQQTTGNWPGVTVEQKSGLFELHDKKYKLIDLPGVYSLENSNHKGLDERITSEFVSTQSPDIVLNVVDATNLERQLFLSAQLLHMGLPVVVVLNSMDKLKELNLHIDIDKLSEKLGCPVIPISAYHNKGVAELKQQLPTHLNRNAKLYLDLPDRLHQSVHEVSQQQNYDESSSCWKSLQMLIFPNQAPEKIRNHCTAEKEELEAHFSEDLALIAADLYFQFAHDATHASQENTDKFSKNCTDEIDRWVLHPLLGLPIFLVIMYFLFAASIAIGNTFIDLFDLGAQALFVDGPTALLNSINAPDWLIAFLAQGIGGGMQVVATFVPVIAALFLLLSIMEESGYMQRAALIMDSLMRRIGLSGQAFVPLVVGLGCNIPAVLASRTLPDHRDRIMTIMMTPFMSCSARLTVYVMFATAFFSEHAALIVFSLYLVGILAAILTALLLKHTLLPGKAPQLLIELPKYQKPAVLNVLLNTRNKMKSFILDAGKVIVLVVLALNFFNSLGTDGSFGHENQPTSVLSSTAKSLTPIVAPLGVTEENWPATVGIFTGLLAKEVVVGSLDALYQQQKSEDNNDGYDLITALSEALKTVPENVTGFVEGIIDPLGLQSIEDVNDRNAIAEDQGFTPSTLDKMVNQFDGAVGAYAYLLLILLYFPCVATFGAIKQELGWRWALYSGGWSMLLGYSVAVLFYQLANYQSHPMQSLAWLTIISILFMILYLSLWKIGKPYRTNHEKT